MLYRLFCDSGKHSVPLNGDQLEKWSKKWEEKSERTLGKGEKGIWLKMLSEKDKELKRFLLTRRTPISDNQRIDKETI